MLAVWMAFCLPPALPSSLDRAAALSKARFAFAQAPGDPLPPDGQDSSPEFYPQGRSDVRYVVLEGDDDPPYVCLIAQSYDGRRVRRLWKLPTMRVPPGGYNPRTGALAAALFARGFVPARGPEGKVAEALARRTGLAGYYVSGPGSAAYAWFVDSAGKGLPGHRTELGTNAGWTAATYYPITPEERKALGW